MNARAQTASAGSKPLPSLTRTSANVLQRQAKSDANLKADTDDDRKRREKLAGQVLQRSAAGPAQSGAVPPIVHQALGSPGEPLDAPTRESMEPRFGHDFGAVRVHHDSLAAASARAVNANAYTVGNDIVFDSGRYDTTSTSGRRLLAHELAHTVQQGGLQRSASDPITPADAVDGRLEREAESAADTVLSPGESSAPRLSRVGSPVLSREPADSAPDVENETAPAASAPAVDNNQEYGPLKNGYGTSVLVRRLTGKGLVRGTSPSVGQQGNKWDTLLKRAHGNGSFYIRGHLLNDNLGGPGNTWDNLTPLSGETNNWGKESHLNKFETPVKDAVLKHGKVVSFSVVAKYDRPSKAAVIKELRDKGTPESKTKADIVEAEQEIPSELICSAEEIAPATPNSGAARTEAHLSLKDVPVKNIIHDENPENYVLRDGSNKSPAATTEDYVVKIGGKDVTFQVSKGAKESDISGQPGAGNAEGMILKKLVRRGHKNDHVIAMLPTAGGPGGSGGAGLPLEIGEKANEVTLTVGKQNRELKYEGKKAHIPIEYKPLSPGVITSLHYDDATGLSGAGTITPSIPLLRGAKIGIEFSKSQLRATTSIPKEKLKSLPGMRIKDAKVELDLTNGFKPSGNIDFEIGPEKKPVATGNIKVSADSQGFLAQGKLVANVPGLDQADGDVTYRKETGWTGGFTVSKSGKTFVENASVHVGFSDKEGLDLTGNIGVKLPGEQRVTVAIERAKGGSHPKWVFKGKGEFNVPGGKLRPVTIHFTHDGEHLSGWGETSVKFHGMSGRLKVSYYEGRISGEGTLKIDKGRASGEIDLKLSSRQRFSAKGRITYKVTDNLITTAGLEIDENEKVTVSGALEFPKPIQLFKPIKGDYKLFEVGISIPIPGASIGGVGLKARIEGGMDAGFNIGPGELRHVRIEALANPFEDKPDLDLTLQGQLYIAAGARVSGHISGSVVLDLALASISGGLTVTATAMLDGHIASQLKVHYAKGRLEVNADLDMMLALVIKLALDAFVKGEAGLGPFKVSKRKDWNLARYTYDPGLKVGLKTKSPIRYVSDEPFKAPSLDQIEIIKPRFDVEDALKKSFKQGEGPEKET